MKRSLSHQRDWTRRQTLQFLAGVTGSLAFNACTRSNSTAPSAIADPISAAFGTNVWIGCAPLYIAQEKQFFQEAGLKLDLKNFTSSAEAIPAFSTGQLQGMAPITSPEVVLLAEQGVQFRVVGVMDTSNGADAVLARNSVKSIEDFKGREVAVQKGSLAHFFLLQILADAGLSEDDITIVNIAPDLAAAAYQAGTAEIACTFSPYLEKANEAQKDGRIIYDSSKKPTAIFDLYMVNADFAEQHPEAVQGFLSSVFQGLEFLNSQPQAAHAIVAKYLDVEPNEVAAQLKGVQLPDLRTNLEMLSNAQSELYLLKSMDAMGEFLKSKGQIATVPDTSQTIDLQFLKALSTNA